MTRTEEAAPGRFQELGGLALLLGPAAAIVVGLFASGILDYAVWKHSRALLVLAAGCLASQAICYVTLRSRIGFSAIAAGGLLFWLVAFAYYAGLQSAASALLLVGCALAVASFVDSGNGGHVSARVLFGLAVMVAAVGWLLPFPIHDSRLYLLVATMLIAWRQAYVRADAKQAWSSWLHLSAAHPLLFAAVVLVGGFASLGLWLPTVNYDDQSAHLILQNQLLRDGYYHFDVFSQVWAVAPWFNNVLHAVSAMFIGESARAPVGLVWLLLGMVGAYRLARALGASESAGLLAALIFSSHPLTSYFGATLQVDGAVAVVMLHLAATLVEWRGSFVAPWRLGVLIGALLAIKITDVIYLLLPCGYVAWIALRHGQWRWLFGVVATSLAIGASSYVYALVITGSPVFPLFNTFFQSPYFPLQEFSDSRWHASIGFTTVWDLTFDTPKYMEAYRGAAGVALFALLGGVVLSLLQRSAIRWVALWCCIAGALMFAQIQYLRYVFPAIAVLCTVSVAAFDLFATRRSVLAAVAFALAIFNLLLMPTTNWFMHDGVWNRLLSQGRGYDDALVAAAAPHRSLMSRLELRSGESCVLNADPEAPFIASAPGRALSVAWYDPEVNRAWSWSNAEADGHRWQQTLGALGVSHVIVPQVGNPSLHKALSNMGASVEDRQATLELWSLSNAGRPTCDWRFISSRDRAHRLLHPWDTH